jgi:hypothetical protein
MLDHNSTHTFLEEKNDSDGKLLTTTTVCCVCSVY